MKLCTNNTAGKLIALLLFIVLAAPVFAADTASNFYPTTIGNLTANVRVYGWGMVSGLKDGQETTVQVLTFQESPLQSMELIREALYINGKVILPKRITDEFGNNYAKFTITENGDFNYELIAKINVSSLIYKLEDFNLSDAPQIPENEKIYIAPSQKIESDSSEIKTLVKNKLLEKGFIETLNKTVSWVNDYVQYAEGKDFQEYYVLQKSAIETLRNKKGVCDEFANLGAAMLRAKGIPTKIIIGITFDGKEWGNHAWIEVKNNKDEWIPSDPTFREAGFVDATHIKMGSYSDVTLSLAKAFYPANSNIFFYTQTIPEVRILDKKYFDAVNVEIENAELKEKRWNNIKVRVTNKTNGEIIAPVSMPEKFSSLYVRETSKVVFLNPNETKEVDFLIYPDIILNNQVATAKLRINSLSEPIEKDFTIVSSLPLENGEVKVNDLTPIISGNDLKVNIEIANYFTKYSYVNVTIYDGDSNLSSKESVLPFILSDNNRTPAVQNIIKEIKSFKEQAYSIKVETPTEIYLQSVYPVKTNSVSPNEKDKNESGGENAIIQHITPQKEETLIEYLTGHPAIPLGIILFGILSALLIVVGRNKRYI
ncbi:MAG: transglutaminase-like domain-containing protein [Candidatus Diapherotrites archaeon]|nr:transglutaminase-like domain-containing protein [Candidatus Diapherotrites archaeon]